MLGISRNTNPVLQEGVLAFWFSMFKWLCFETFVALLKDQRAAFALVLWASWESLG